MKTKVYGFKKAWKTRNFFLLLCCHPVLLCYYSLGGRTSLSGGVHSTNWSLVVVYALFLAMSDDSQTDDFTQ